MQPCGLSCRLISASGCQSAGWCGQRCCDRTMLFVVQLCDCWKPLEYPDEWRAWESSSRHVDGGAASPQASWRIGKISWEVDARGKGIRKTRCEWGWGALVCAGTNDSLFLIGRACPIHPRIPAGQRAGYCRWAGQAVEEGYEYPIGYSI